MDNFSLFTALMNTGKGYQLWVDAWFRSGWRIQEHVLTGESRVISPAKKTICQGDGEACLALAKQHAPANRHTHAILMLHGLGRSGKYFQPLAARLKENGLLPVIVNYASLSDTPDNTVKRLRGLIEGLALDGITRVSLVGHSLGGLLIRKLCAEPLPVELGRIVMLGTPNQGSRFGLASATHEFSQRPYNTLFGAFGSVVLPSAAPNLPVPATEMLVIAGGTGGRGYNPFLEGDNDGIVMVAETGLQGAQSLLVPSLHSFLPPNRRAMSATLTFLQTGKPA